MIAPTGWAQLIILVSVWISMFVMIGVILYLTSQVSNNRKPTMLRLKEFTTLEDARPITMLACRDVWPADLKLPIDLIHVIDGDTIVANIRLPWDIMLSAQMIRAADYDTWESRRVQRAGSNGISDAEIARGKIACEVLKNMLEKADYVYVTPAPQPRDNFGRILGILSVQNGDTVTKVGPYMQRNGHDRNVGRK